jgi:hypothetical protein
MGNMINAGLFGIINNTVTYRGVCARLTKRVLKWMIGFTDTFYTHTTRDYRHYRTIAILHTLQFTVTHALGLSVFTSRILATDLSQSHCNFKSHMNPNLHRLIYFFFPYSATANSEDSTQFNSTLISRQLGVPKLDCSLSTTVLYSVASSVSFYNP